MSASSYQRGGGSTACSSPCATQLLYQASQARLGRLSALKITCMAVGTFSLPSLAQALAVAQGQAVDPFNVQSYACIKLWVLIDARSICLLLLHRKENIESTKNFLYFKSFIPDSLFHQLSGFSRQIQYGEVYLLLHFQKCKF